MKSKLTSQTPIKQLPPLNMNTVKRKRQKISDPASLSLHLVVPVASLANAHSKANINTATHFFDFEASTGGGGGSGSGRLPCYMLESVSRLALERAGRNTVAIVMSL